jgi:hypothetical protein
MNSTKRSHKLPTGAIGIRTHPSERRGAKFVQEHRAMVRELDALDGNEQRIVRFRPRQEAETRRRLTHRLMIEQDLAEPRLNRLVKFELEVDGNESNDEYRHRLFISGLAFLINIFLVVVGVWLVTNLQR